MYFKLHSMGEFVFDYEWAEAAHHAGIQYYPKMLVGVPFTPVTGHRFLTAQGEDRSQLIRFMGQALAKIAADNKISSVHVNFCLADEREALEQVGFFPRVGIQYHWQNRNFTSFDDYLNSFRSDRRNKVKRERREIAQRGITIRAYEGAELTQNHVRTMFRLYKGHVDRLYYGRQYLTQNFFDELHRRFAVSSLSDARRARRQVHRRHFQRARRHRHVRPLLGRVRRASVSAFQRLLLLGHRAFDPPGLAALRGRAPAEASSNCAGWIRSTRPASITSSTANFAAPSSDFSIKNAK